MNFVSQLVCIENREREKPTSIKVQIADQAGGSQAGHKLALEAAASHCQFVKVSKGTRN